MPTKPENRVAFFARTNFRGEQRVFGIRQADRRAHMYVIGKTGTGNPKDVPPEIMQKLLRGLKPSAEELAALCIIKVRPAGEFVTYGVGVSMQTMRNPQRLKCGAPHPQAN